MQLSSIGNEIFTIELLEVIKLCFRYPATLMTDACLRILQYENMSRALVCPASPVFELLTVLKMANLPMFNKKELNLWRIGHYQIHRRRLFLMFLSNLHSNHSTL